jgi:hypothetical protein
MVVQSLDVYDRSEGKSVRVDATRYHVTLSYPPIQFGIFGTLTAVLGLLGVPIYFWGKNIRQFTRSAKSKSD